MDDWRARMKHATSKLLIGLLILGLLIAGAAWLVRYAEPGNPPIVFPDGGSLRLLDVTAGTNHMYGSTLVKALNRLPREWRNPC